MFCRTLAFALLLAAGTALAQAEDRLRTDCDAPAHFRVLARSDMPAEAAAIWLDAQRLRWPQAPAEADIVLLHADTAIGLDAERRPDPEVTRFELKRLTEALPPAQQRRFAWFGDGAEFALPDGTDIAGLLRGDLLLAALDTEGRVLAMTRVQQAAALDDRYAAARQAGLGALPETDATAFALWAPTAQSVAVCVYEDGDSPARSTHTLERDAASGVWSARLPGVTLGSYYSYLVDVFVPGLGLVRNRVTDPYALGLGADGQRAMVVDLDDARFKPEGWDAHPRPPAPRHNVDMVLYELHVRDFSRDDASVPPQHRGRYLGFAQRDSLGMRHLRSLAEAGLTDVHLLPVYDISTIPETGCVTPVVMGPPDGEQQQATIATIKHEDCFNWGYDPQHFTVPEGSYASDARDGAVRIRELRRMVMALHALGLRVGLDVVYNHSSHAGQHAKSVLDRIVPGYYHRLDPKGAIERSTCCENTATEHAMMARLMIDSAVVWARDYRIDGFRFDLMGHQPKAVMLELMRAVDSAAGKRIPIIGEGWNFGEVADGARFEQASQLSLAGSGIATFSDRARDALRGGGAATAGAELRTAYGWLNGWVASRDWELGIRDSEERESPAPPPLSPGGKGAGGEGLEAAPSTARASSAEAALPNPESPIPNPGSQSRLPNPGSNADLVRVGLAGTLRQYRMRGSDGIERSLAEFDYAGQPAGYVASPNEVVNYVENHDNQTLYDINALRLPQATTAEERARVQVLGMAFNLLSQGVPYFHAGVEVLRSKSLDRNSYDSGDHFNRLDYSGEDNSFGRGLPPAWDNARDWPLMRELLADPALKPSPEIVDYTRRAFLDWLRLRAQTPLLRLASSEDVQQRLRFLDTDARSGVIAAYVDGSGLAANPHAQLLYAVNVSSEAQQLGIDWNGSTDGRRAWRLHPALLDGVDPRAREATLRFEPSPAPQRMRVLLQLPARTAVVWVASDATN
ncbi:Carbohydrate-binding module 48 (Isoamylase N-terminal domain) [Aquimonas voraii]|uniref:Carbohydrate-binding module 48 (Isoamylase N-terminal domain) n=1 Tax=Aquimonas voraii TaxID=265719 RepID=A0A1G6YVP9_9GAMM|nr:Carbohydrate-binding module 48 (Isoamylase N-terminal domain) [Aquimonas voraii]